MNIYLYCLDQPKVVETDLLAIGAHFLEVFFGSLKPSRDVHHLEVCPTALDQKVQWLKKGYVHSYIIGFVIGTF